VLVDPKRLHPLEPFGFLIRRVASVLIAAQAVCQSSPRCRAIAETVASSCRNASVAHKIAQAVSLARLPAVWELRR
jgi:hypothetical protein